MRFILFILVFLTACKTEQKTIQKLSGSTMGTTYSISYVGNSPHLEDKISQALEQVNASVSTYIPTSTISKVNQAKTNDTLLVDSIFIENFLLAKQIHDQTEGSFNPAIMPLVNYWGFGYETFINNAFDSLEVKELLTYSLFSNFELQDSLLIKKDARSQLDFSGSAKGYGVDYIGRLLNAQGIENYLIEIGGEILAKGNKPNGKSWVVAIRQPLNKHEYSTTIHLENEAMATSGNYEQYKHIDSVKTISHTINPFTGFPQELLHEVLSVSVIAPNCAQADGLATACKVMGIEKTKRIAKQLEDVQVYLIYLDKNNELQSEYIE